MKLKSLQLAALILLSPSCFAQSENTTPSTPINYGKTVIAIAPLSLTEISKGVGVSYERAIDKEGIVALWIPVSFGFKTYDDYAYNSSIVYGNFYAMPGIKIYPTGSFSKCKYSIGPNLMFATGNKPSDYNYNYGYGGETVSFLKMGFMLNNSLNLNPLPHLYLGLDFGFGITYLSEENNINKNSTEGLVHFAFRIGYRN